MGRLIFFGRDKKYNKSATGLILWEDIYPMKTILLLILLMLYTEANGFQLLLRLMSWFFGFKLEAGWLKKDSKSSLRPVASRHATNPNLSPFDLLLADKKEPPLPTNPNPFPSPRPPKRP